MELMEHQLDVIEKLDNGKILWGATGTGKSMAVLGYYMKYEAPKHIYIITTAKKRDSLDWESEAARFGIGTEDYATVAGIITVDSWNQLKNYVDIEDAFFVFDEQRLVGYGAWVKYFLKIAKKNRWILLTATPGDNWMDYIPIFIANGFYRNKTEFLRKHVLYEPFIKFPKVRGYLNETKLELIRNEILVEMPFIKHTERMLNWTYVSHDAKKLKKVYKDRWNVFENKPVKDANELFRLMRKVVNTDPSRFEQILWLMEAHPRLIIFYNFNYELEILRGLREYVTVAEWNGHKKESLPDSPNWVYLVQYIAGAEGWNCTATDAVILYSLTYSYKNFEQAQGRIDRLDTPFTILYYYVFVSDSIVDRAIKKAIGSKKNFNERKFIRDLSENSENWE